MSDNEEDYGDDGDEGGRPPPAEGDGSETPLGEDGFPVVTARKLQQQMNPMQLRMAELKKKQEEERKKAEKAAKLQAMAGAFSKNISQMDAAKKKEEEAKRKAEEEAKRKAEEEAAARAGAPKLDSRTKEMMSSGIAGKSRGLAATRARGRGRGGGAGLGSRTPNTGSVYGGDSPLPTPGDTSGMDGDDNASRGGFAPSASKGGSGSDSSSDSEDERRRRRREAKAAGGATAAPPPAAASSGIRQPLSVSAASAASATARASSHSGDSPAPPPISIAHAKPPTAGGAAAAAPAAAAAAAAAAASGGARSRKESNAAAAASASAGAPPPPPPGGARTLPATQSFTGSVSSYTSYDTGGGSASEAPTPQLGGRSAGGFHAPAPSHGGGRDDDAWSDDDRPAGGGIRAGGVSSRLAFEPTSTPHVNVPGGSGSGHETSPFTPAPTPQLGSGVAVPTSLPPFPGAAGVGGIGAAHAAAAHGSGNASSARAAAVAAARRGSAQQSPMMPPAPNSLSYRELLALRRRVIAAAAVGVDAGDHHGGGSSGSALPAPLARALSGLLPPNCSASSAAEVLGQVYTPEALLRPDEFARVFETPPEAFGSLPAWQRRALKKKLKLGA